MWITRPALAALLVAAMGLPAMAQPIEIATLGRAPMMGSSTNPAELQYNFRKNEALMRQAGMDLGLTREQYEQFRLALEVGKPNWVTVPRHLDAMTWQSGGQIHVLHDVIIPANQKGVEVDLHAGDKIIALFLPAKCGNLSVIRRTVPHVATVRNFPVPHVAAAQAPPPAQDVAAVVPPPPPPEVAAAIPLPPPPVVARHGFSLLPLAALLPFIVNTGGGGGGSTPSGGTIVGPPPCP
jgi:hypothetical protein